jgi:hypothetical protein
MKENLGKFDIRGNDDDDDEDLFGGFLRKVGILLMD